MWLCWSIWGGDNCTCRAFAADAGRCDVAEESEASFWWVAALKESRDTPWNDMAR
jgi:hypothetical protein